MRHHRNVMAAGLLAALLSVAACEGGPEADDGGGAVESDAVSAGPVVITPEAQTPLALRAGIYRVTWKTTDCPSIKLSFVGDNGFSREKTSTLPTQSWLITSVPAGTYQVSQTDPACTDWELTVERLAGT